LPEESAKKGASGAKPTKAGTTKNSGKKSSSSNLGSTAGKAGSEKSSLFGKKKSSPSGGVSSTKAVKGKNK